MAAEFFAELDCIPVETLNVLVYGRPDCGKTTLANGSDSPVLFDFDKGAHRGKGHKGVFRFQKWEDVLELLNPPVGQPNKLKSYRTVIIDTVGACLDLLAEYLMRLDPKNKNGFTGGLSLPGYGVLADHFRIFMANLRSRGLSCIMLSHDKEEKVGEVMYVRPDIVGKTQGAVLRTADVCAYMHRRGEERILDFNPTNVSGLNTVGKNAPQFECPMPVPHYREYPEFMQWLINEGKTRLGQLSEEQREALQRIDEYREQIGKAEDAEAMEMVAADMKLEPTVIKLQIAPDFTRRLGELKLVRSKDGKYLPAEAEKEADTAAQEDTQAAENPSGEGQVSPEAGSGAEAPVNEAGNSEKDKTDKGPKTSKSKAKAPVA